MEAPKPNDAMKRENNKSHPMTLERLGRMVARGFESVDKRFDGIDGRLAAVERRLGSVELKVDDVHDAVTRLEEGAILDLHKWVQTLERSVKGLAKQADWIESALNVRL